jgi:AcrR family transcriptional regulator
MTIARPSVQPRKPAVTGYENPGQSSPAVTERGQRTRRALMNAALDFMGAGKNFSSLSIREITKQVGIVPTAFYRHFPGLDELGLAIVDDCGHSLREELRKIRQNSLSSKQMIRDSFLVFRQYVEEQPKYFLVASGERHGGSPLMREAIRSEIGRFIEEMAEDISSLGLVPHLSRNTVHNVCDLVINVMLSAASEILDWRKDETELNDEKTEAYVQQLSIIFLGAGAWQEEAAVPEPAKRTKKAGARSGR